MLFLNKANMYHYLSYFYFLYIPYLSYLFCILYPILNVCKKDIMKNFCCARKSEIITAYSFWMRNSTISDKIMTRIRDSILRYFLYP